MDSFQSLYNQALFLLSNITWLEVIDLLLVTAALYFLLSLVQRSSAAYLLREMLVLGMALFVLTILLPLPVFDWLVRGMLVAMLVAIPIIFQTQLRRFLERAGRSVGIAQMVRQSVAENVLPELVHAVENMSASQTGALIVLEGNDSLEELAKSGVSFNGWVTGELLQSIFYPGTPLHDGAVIIRTDQIVAAGCVLPLTQQSLQSEKRLGTRHRAAVGLSEISDALIVVVSEETGQIGVADRGQLQRPLSSAELRERLLDFYDPTITTSATISLWGLMGQAGRQFWHSLSLANPRQFLSNIGLLFVSLLLTLMIWSFVIEQTNPLQRARVEGIPLRIENVPPNTKLIPPPPASVSAIIQTTDDVLPTLSPRSFQAVVSLQGSSPGFYRLPVRVNFGSAQVLILSVDPPALDLELAPIISRTLPVMVDIPDQQNLSAAYELVGSPTASPDQVQVVGPVPLVNQVDRIRTTISLANASTSLRETRPLQALDAQNREITEVNLQPNQVQVSVSIRQRLNARNVSVRIVTSGIPPPGYWLSNLSVTPAGVTLKGSPDQLANVGSFVDTLPIDVSQAVGELSVQIPLDLPPKVQALDGNGNIVEAVTVLARVAARRGDLAVTRPVELLESRPNGTVTINPAAVDLLLSGPLPVLSEIEVNPRLVRVLIDTASLRRGQSISLTPTIIAPANVQWQLVPPSVLVTFQ